MVRMTSFRAWVAKEAGDDSLVELPDDLSAYLPAKTVLEFIPDKFTGSTALKKYCKENGIPYDNPTPRRLVVHVAKLLIQLRADEPDNEKLIGIVERYAQLREEKDRQAGK